MIWVASYRFVVERRVERKTPCMPLSINRTVCKRRSAQVFKKSQRMSNATEMRTVSLHANGKERVLTIEPRVSLLDALRDHLALTGTKKGCNQGACGACTVLVDGERINSCLALAIQYQGCEIVTIEGLAHGNELYPMQQL
jgi:xanthine dehydrogenase YagT iron-sulfur-binding subunit